MRSTAHLDSVQLTVTPQGWARLWGMAVRAFVIPVDEIESEECVSASEVGKLLGWKIGGTAFSRQRAMGWFSLRGQRGARAWVWLTPRRKVRVFRVNHGRLRLVAIPVDWFND